MKTHTLSGWLYAATLMFLLTCWAHTAAADDGYVLTNKAGQSINVRILDYSQDHVRIQRIEDNRTFPPIPLESLNEESQQIIIDWARQRALDMGRLFEVSVSRSRANVRRSRGAISYTNWDAFYTVTVNNRSGLDFEDLRVDYLIFRTQQRPGISRDDLYERRSGKQEIKKLLRREDFRFDTISFPMQETRLSSGWYWADGSPRRSSANLEGIWLRIYDGEEMLFEYMIPEGLHSREEW